jgi:hypothetical protein
MERILHRRELARKRYVKGKELKRKVYLESVLSNDPPEEIATICHYYLNNDEPLSPGTIKMLKPFAPEK